MAVGLSAVGFALASRLEMQTSRLDLLSSRNEEVKNYDRFTDEFGTANNVYFVIESASLERSKRCADTLAAEISKHPAYIRDALYKLDVDAFKRRLFLYLSSDRLRRLNGYLSENWAQLEALAGAKNLNAVFSAIAQLAERRSAADFKKPSTELELAALSRLLESLSSYVFEGDNAVEFLPSLVSELFPFGVSNDAEGYLVGKDGRIVLLLARPNSEREDSIAFLRPMMNSLTEARRRTLEQFPDVTIGMTGLPTFAYGDLRVMENEIPLLSLGALGLIVLIFLLFFRHPLEIGFASLAIASAILCTLGIARLLIGHLNIMTSVFAVTLIGLGIDFGVHFISRFYDEQAHGESVDEAIGKTLRGSGPPIATGALTTAAAFYMLTVSDFKGLAELGVIVGTGIVLSMVWMLAVVASLISLRGRRRRLSAPSRSDTETLLTRVIGRVAVSVEAGAKPLLVLATALTLAMCFFAPRVRFDYNFLHIQPVNSDAVEYEEVLMERTGLAPSFNVIVKDDQKALGEAVDLLARMPSVSRVDSANQLVPINQEERIRNAREIVGRIRALKELVGPGHQGPDLQRLVEHYEEMQRGLETTLEARAIVGSERAALEMERSLRAVRGFLEKVGDRPGVQARLEAFSDALFSHFEGELSFLTATEQLENVTFDDLPENMRTRFVGRTGKYAAYVFPSQSIWNKAFLDRFNADVKSVAPDATGSALFAQTLLDIAGRALRQCSLLVLAAVIVLLFLDFRRFAPTMLALLSVTVGVIWMLGLMRLLGWQYNPINIMAVPLTLGIGIDNGVHIVHRFRDNGRDVRAALLTSGRAIAVSSLTTMAGFTCLLFSTHRGLISLGQLMVLGVGSCLVASLTVLPATLKAVSDAGIEV